MGAHQVGKIMTVVSTRWAVPADRTHISRLLHEAGNFSAEECDVGLEIVDVFLGNGPTSGADGDYPTVVAERDGVVVGYATFGRTPMTDGTWHLYFIAADASIRRAGIGRALCAQIRNVAVARAGRRLVLETSGRELYGGTRTFYVATGFVEEARIADYYAPDDPVVYFVWRW
jgi:ribosomal protein S18 acetylase RimI-like enzyme